MRYKTALIVNFEHLKDNFVLLKKLAPKAQVMMMIKAYAYGHGMIPVVRYACEEVGISEFGCASLGEAKELREALPHLNFELYVFSDLALDVPGCAEVYRERRILPVISDIQDLQTFLDSKELKHVPLSLKFNLGMNRLGINTQNDEYARALELLKSRGRTDLHHVMAHLANSSSKIDQRSDSHTKWESFQSLKADLIKQGFRFKYSSLSNSGAIEQKLGTESETHIRPGLMLYGPSALDPDIRGEWKGKLLSRLHTVILKTLMIQKGDPIGYGSTPAPYDGLLAITAMGYGDGISPTYRGVKVQHLGFTGEFVGKINMDMSAILFPVQAEGKILKGQELALWDERPESLLNLAEQIGIIPYVVLCQLSSRVPRIYFASAHKNKAVSSGH